MNPFQQVDIGRTGVQVTSLGLGGAPLSGMTLAEGIYSGSSFGTALNIIRKAYDLGIRYFDTAPLYGSGRSEVRYSHVLTYLIKARVPSFFTGVTGTGKSVFLKLLVGLIQMISVEMRIAEGVDELTRLETGDMGDQVVQQRIARDVEWHAQEYVGAALIELAAQSTVLNVELK